MLVTCWAISKDKGIETMPTKTMVIISSIRVKPLICLWINLGWDLIITGYARSAGIIVGLDCPIDIGASFFPGSLDNKRIILGCRINGQALA